MNKMENRILKNENFENIFLRQIDLYAVPFSGIVFYLYYINLKIYLYY